MYLSKYFTEREVACKCGCNLVALKLDTLFVADRIREWRGKPITPSSCCRCPDHNYAVGGSPRSRHLPRQTVNGIACDAMDLPDENPQEIAEWLEVNEPTVSYGVYDTFIHIDNRPIKATWDKRGIN